MSGATLHWRVPGWGPLAGCIDPELFQRAACSCKTHSVTSAFVDSELAVGPTMLSGKVDSYTSLEVKLDWVCPVVTRSQSE